YDVTTAPTAKEGLARAKDGLPDLILLDYLLPDMKGDEVTAKLFEDAETAKLPIVYMSGFGADLQSGKMASHNVIVFLNKPFTSDLLIKTVEEHIPKSPEEPEPIKIEAEPALRHRRKIWLKPSRFQFLKSTLLRRRLHRQNLWRSKLLRQRVH